MQTYILSVVGMIIVAVISGIILPEGKMNSYVKSTVALFLFFVIVSPIIKFIKGDATFNDININLQENFLFDTTSSQIENLKNRISNSLQNNFSLLVDVEIDWENSNGVVEPKKVEIWVMNSGDVSHTYDIDEVIDHVASLIKIEKEQVVVYV